MARKRGSSESLIATGLYSLGYIVIPLILIFLFTMLIRNRPEAFTDVFYIKGKSGFDINNKDFTDMDQHNKLQKINQNIDKNKGLLDNLNQERAKMNVNIDKLNREIDVLKKERSDFVKRQEAIKDRLAQ
jgi:peptidoglycan hydrolase CwlO-like protein